MEKKKKRKKARQVSRKSIAEIFRERSCNNRVKVPRKKPFNDTRARYKRKKKYSNKIRNIVWVPKKASYTYRNEKRIKGIRK